MMIEKIPILPLGTDGDCHPVVIKLQRFPMVATKPPALALGEVVFTSTPPVIINAALPQREAKRLKVLKPATSETKDVNVDTLPSAQLEIGQSFSVQGRQGTFTVVDKTIDPRCHTGKLGPLPPAYWIITDSPELRSFHTGQIPNVCAVVKVTPAETVKKIVEFVPPVEVDLETITYADALAFNSKAGRVILTAQQQIDAANREVWMNHQRRMEAMNESA